MFVGMCLCCMLFVRKEKATRFRRKTMQDDQLTKKEEKARSFFLFVVLSVCSALFRFIWLRSESTTHFLQGVLLARTVKVTGPASRIENGTTQPFPEK